MSDEIIDGIHCNTVYHSLDSIDVAKFVGSILIFAMHCTAFGDYKNAQSVLEIMARWGVSFFFISSSFFIFRKSAGGILERKQLLHYVFRISMLYLWWMIINLPSIYIVRLKHLDLTTVYSWLVFLKNSLLSSTFTGSWYLISCIFSVWLVNWFSKRFKSIIVILLSFPLYLLCVFTSVYKGVLPVQVSRILSILCFPLNIFNGCFYFAIGKYMSENEAVLNKYLTKTRALVFFVMAYLLFIIEIFVTKHYHVLGTTDVAFSTVALACTLFIFCLQTKIKIKKARLLRRLSIIIYCCQSNVLIINDLCKNKLGGHSIIAFIISCILVAVVSIVILIIQKRSRWKWVNYLT